MKDPWEASKIDYDRSIHSNRDAKAWADFFVATYPGLADKHDIMLTWFANAMMAMHDSLKQEVGSVVAPPPGDRVGWVRVDRWKNEGGRAVWVNLDEVLQAGRLRSIPADRVLGEGMRQIDARRFARMQAEEAERPYLLELERYVRTMARLQNWSKDTTGHGPLSSLDHLRSNQGGAAT